MTQKQQAVDRTRWGLVAFLTVALVASGVPVFGLSGGDTASSPAGTHTVCADDCDHSSIQDAIDAAATGDIIRVGPGTYKEAITVPAHKNGLALVADEEHEATILLPSTTETVRLEAESVFLYGFQIEQSPDATAIEALAKGIVLRENQIQGKLAVPEAVEGIEVDARLNDWGTSGIAAVVERLDIPTSTVLVSPFRLADGSQHPPAPTVVHSGHCDAQGFEPRFIEEAFWCAHAGSVIVLHEANDLVNQTLVVPYSPVMGGEDHPDGNIISKNRALFSFGVDDPDCPTFPGQHWSQPCWGVGFESDPDHGGGEDLVGLTLCSGGPKDHNINPPPPPSSGEDCEHNPEGVIVDAGVGILSYHLGDTDLVASGDNRRLVHTLDVQAAGVTITGLTIQHTTHQEDRHGIVLRGEDGNLEANVIRGNFLPHEHAGDGDGSFSTLHQIGVVVRGSSALVEDNEVRGWANIGIIVGSNAGEGNQIVANHVHQNRWHGFLLEGPRGDGPTLEVRGNTIAAHSHSAVRFGVDDTSGFEVRDNIFALTNLNGVTVQEGIQDAVIDVRGNDWSLYKHELLPLRVDDESGTNTVQLVPFIDAEGDYEPPLVRQIPPGSTAPYPRFFGIQEAIDHEDTVPGTKIHVPAGKYTPWMESVVVDKPSIELCGQASDINPCNIGGPLLERPVVKSSGAPAFHVQADDVVLQGFEAVSDSGTGILIAGDDALLTDLTVRVAGPEPIVGIDGAGTNTGLTVRDSRILPATDEVAIIGEDGIRGRFVESVFEDNEIIGFASGIRLRPYGDDNQVRGNLLLLLNTGVVTFSENTVIDRNGFLAVNTGVDVATIDDAGQSADGTVITENDLLATVTGLRLRTDHTVVDATCNDWGAYTAGGVENKIDDQGTGNVVEFLPFISPDSSSPGLFQCLTLPIADFTVNPTDPLRGQQVTFTDTSEEGSNAIVRRDWNFGDGTNQTQFAPFLSDSVTHTYDEAGVFLATLRVTDSQGAHRFAVQPITVVGPAPVIGGVASHVAKADLPLSLNFTAYDPQGTGEVTLSAALLGGSVLPTGVELVKDAQPDHWRLEWTPSVVQAGVYLIELTATTGQGVEQTHLLELEITADEAPERLVALGANTVEPTAVSPGEQFTMMATLLNTGGVPVEVFMNVTAQGDWVAMVNESAISLDVGQDVLVPVEIEVGMNTTKARVTASAHVMGSPDASRQVTWQFEAPLKVVIEMTNTTAGSDIVGVAQVTFNDGTPATGVPVTGVRTNGFDTTGLLQDAFSGQTNETGAFRFSFTTGNTAAQLPGTHTVDVVASSGASSYRGHSVYQVGPPLL